MDDADRAQERMELEQAMKFIHAALGYRVDLAQGMPGECVECGEKSIRLIEMKCARCRDQEVKDLALRVAVVRNVL